MIGVSRTPVREAIGRLESEGLVEQVPRLGAFVRRFSREEMADLYDLRILVEGYCAERAARYVSDVDLDDLSQIQERHREILEAHRCSDGWLNSEFDAEWRRLDLKLHTSIVRLSQNKLAGKVIADFRVMSKLCPQFTHPTKSAFRVICDTWASHARVVKALQRRDPTAAASAMRDHIAQAKIEVLKAYDHSLSLETQPDNNLSSLLV